MTHPFGDLGPVIISALGAPSAITVRRYVPGAYDSATGLWVEGTSSDTLTDAVVQPSGPREIAQLPENERTKEAITTFTIDSLKTSDVAGAEQSDEVIFQGKRYKVMISVDWEVQANFSRSICTRIGE
jgi:hypothetical protein